jgi:hypothetical protein
VIENSELARRVESNPNPIGQLNCERNAHARRAKPLTSPQAKIGVILEGNSSLYECGVYTQQ